MRIPALAAATLLAAPLHAQAAFPPGPGQAQVQAACSMCHAVTVVTSKRYPAAKWDAVVEQMVSRGAPVKDADYDTVVAYLAKNFGPKK